MQSRIVAGPGSSEVAPLSSNQVLPDVPSYADWESRTQRAYFDFSRTRTELGWKPASYRQRVVDEGIGVALEAIK